MPLSITEHPKAAAAVFEVLELTERAYGLGAAVPDAITSTMLMAALHAHQGTEEDLRQLVGEGVVDASFLVAWRVFTTGDSAAILAPDLQPAQRLFEGTMTGLLPVLPAALGRPTSGQQLLAEHEGVDDALPTGVVVALGDPGASPEDLPQYLTGPLPILSRTTTEQRNTAA